MALLPKKTDVLIVGAGPTGLSLACQFIRYGLDFVIIEKNEAITPFSKALGVHARTLEIYEQLGLGEEAVKRGTIAGKVRMLEGGKVVGEADLSTIGKGLSAYPFMLVLEQSQNERLLYEYVTAHAREVFWNHELTGLNQDESIVTVTVKNEHGDIETIEAKYLAGCDGPRSPVRHALGLSFEGSTFERLFYVADVRIDWKFPHDALHVCLAENGVVAFFPMPGENRWRIVGAFPEGHQKDEGEILYEEIEQRIREEAELELDITRVDWFSVYKVHTRHVERFSKGRCFLAGDSAHIHTPAGGQGMNTGIQDGYNMAWKLAFVLKGYAPEKLLETYNEERLPNARRLLQTTDRMFNLAAGKDWLLNLIRTTIFPPVAKFVLSIDAVKKRFFPLISQIGIHYEHSSLSLHDGDDNLDVRAGDRLPYFLVNGASIYDSLRHPKFHQLFFTNEIITNKQEESDKVDTLGVQIDSHIAELFGSDKPFTVLLRPDNYIGAIAPGMVSDLDERYFTEVIGK